MALRLTLSGGAGRGSRTFSSGTLSIGRGERNDWVLADPERHLSKTHCVLSLENGNCVLTDLSTNGVTINGARQPTTRDSRTVLTDGDTFSLGDYTITLEIVAGDSAAAQPGDPLAIDPLDDPLGRPPDPAFRHPIPVSQPIRRGEDPFDRRDENHRPADPHDDLFAGVKPAQEWSGPSQPDHADAPRHALAIRRAVLPQAPAEIDFDALIGDLSGFEPHSPPRDDRASQLTDFDDLMAPAKPPQPLAQPAPAAPAAPPQAAAPPRPAAGAPADNAEAARALLQAFLDGAGVPSAPVAGDAEAAMRNAGQVFRAMVDGLREVLMSRANIKSEMRIEQTLLRSTDNNVLKFSFSAEDAVIALLSPSRPGYMPPLAAAREALNDIKAHEIAVMAGVQTALLGLLQRFDPKTLEARLSQGMIASMVPAARKARLWDSFRDLHGTIATEAEDDFQAVFGRAFAKAYKLQSKRD